MYWDFNGWACNPVPGPQDAQRRVAIIVTSVNSVYALVSKAFSAAYGRDTGVDYQAVAIVDATWLRRASFASLPVNHLSWEYQLWQRLPCRIVWLTNRWGVTLGCRVLCSPREPHSLEWGPSCSHRKSFQLERERLKLDEKMTDSL